MTHAPRIAGTSESAPAAASRRGDTRIGGGSDFRAALVDAVGASASASAATGSGTHGGDRARHAVKAGETLYGIARDRLSASGHSATPAAAMRLARQIAAVNHIRNPDRILVGQQLDLASSAASASAPGGQSTVPEASAIQARDRGIAGAERAASAPRWDDEHLHEATAADETAALLATAPHGSVVEPNRPDHGAATRDRDPGQDTTASRMPATMPLPAAAPAAAALGEPRLPAGIALYAKTAADSPAAPVQQQPASSPTLPDIVYKGVVGKALDLVPLDPPTRTGLQQASTVIGSSMIGKSLAALTGLGGPVLTVAGLVWGLFSAQKIGSMQAAAPQPAAPDPAKTAIRVAEAPNDAIGD